MRDCWRPTTPCAAFALSFFLYRGSQYKLTLRDSQHSVSESLSADQVRRDQKRQARRNFISLCLRSLTLHNLAWAFQYICKHGFRGLKEHIISRLSTRGIPLRSVVCHPPRHRGGAGGAAGHGTGLSAQNQHCGAHLPHPIVFCGR